jgi:two-component system, OmpR family, phosphate regulon sensor histidine kinase PhoR
MGHPSIRARLQVLLALFALAFLALAFFQYGMARRLFITMLEHDLRGDVIMLSERLEADKAILAPARIDSLCKAISPRKGFRITVTDSEGVVIGDSHVPADKLSEVENHRYRPEFVGASREGWGTHLRSSATVRQEMVYVAHRLPSGHYLRIAAGSPALEGFRRIALTSVGLYLGLFILGALFVTLWVWRRISLPLLQLQRGQHETDKPLRWNAPFREAEVLNQAFDAYVGDIRRLHATVAKEHDRLIEVLNLLEEGVLLLSPTGEVHNLNPAAVKLLAPGESSSQVTYASASNPASGSSAIDITADWVGRNLAELAAIPDLAVFLHDVSRGERPPVLLIDKSEACPRDLLCHLRSLRGDGGEWLLTLVDVSEFRQLDRVKSEFVANASHELKTPLASIRGYAESLIDGAMHDTKAREPFIRKILHNALRLESLIGDLLSLSRLEADKGPRNVEPLPLRRYFNQAAGIYRVGLESAGIRFENHVPEEIEVLAEPRDLELIVNNLFGNAVKYNKPGGKVKVTWDTLPHGGRLTVKDSGVGIPAAMLPRIFERFYRADASRARQEGTGLGLAIVKHACQRYQFTVKAESEMGEGSRFIVEIPGKSLKRIG